jgi:hypothetical protein
MRFHPDGMASLIAVIVAPEDVKAMPIPRQLNRSDLLRLAIDRRHEQVLGLAAQYYKINPCDFDNSVDVQAAVPVNSTNNRAKLDRKNLTK